ncbi:MAG: SIR2 family protein [Tetrasphaera sp.]
MAMAITVSSLLEATASEADEMTVVEPHLSLAFALHSSPGSHVAMLGAGTSTAAGIYAAWEIQQDLISKLAAAQGAKPEDPFSWYRERYGTDSSYDALLDSLTHTPDTRQQLLRGYFEPDPTGGDGARQPTAVHHALARLVALGHIRVVLTTNFDHLVETALRAIGIEPVVASSAADLAGLAPLHTMRCLVVHLHGDYVRADTLLNTPEELGEYPKQVNAFLDRVFDEHGMVILGWSANYDVALREAWSRAANRRFASFWVDPYPLGDVANDLATRRGVVVVIDHADSFLTRTADAVESIAEAGIRHPATTAAAVNLTKKLLATEPTPIRAHDLLRAELAKVETSKVLNPEAWDSQNVPAEVDRRRAIVLADTDTVAALVATLAYWGTPGTDPWWKHDLENLAVHPHVGGSTALIGLAMAPATLLFYTAGAAAAAAGRWDLVTSLLTDLHATDIYTSATANIADILIPTQALGAEAGRTIHDFVCRVCQEHLALNPNAVRDGWEKFAYLDIVAALVRGRHRLDLGPFIRVTDLERREYLPVPTIWAHRLLEDPRGEWIRNLGLSDAVEKAIDATDAALHNLADRAAWKHGGGTLPSGTWLPADHT